jgi:hypothetical protein
MEEKQKVQELMAKLTASNESLAPEIVDMEERLRASKSALGSEPSAITA